MSGLKKTSQEKREGADAETSLTGEKKNKGWSNEIDDLFAGKKVKKRQQVAKTAEAIGKQQQQLAKKRQKSGERTSSRSEMKTNGEEDWVDDGLGGVYNKEGYTGRVEDGVRVFKAHLLRKPQSGRTPDCPFDCDCCYI